MGIPLSTTTPTSSPEENNSMKVAVDDGSVTPNVEEIIDKLTSSPEENNSMKVAMDDDEEVVDDDTSSLPPLEIYSNFSSVIDNIEEAFENFKYDLETYTDYKSITASFD